MVYQNGNRRTAYPLDMSFRELFEQKVYVEPSFFTPKIKTNIATSLETILHKLAYGDSLLITGDPGCGKSFFTYLVQRGFPFYRSETPIYCIALDLRIFISAVATVSNDTPEQHVLKLLWESTDTSTVPLQFAIPLPNAVLFVVDGIDELASNPLHVNNLVELLTTLRKLGTLLVTCRTREFEHIFAPRLRANLFDEFLEVKAWDVNIEFREFIERLVRAGKLPDASILRDVQVSSILQSLVRRPLHARMLTFINAPGVTIKDLAQLYSEYLRKYATVTDVRLASDECAVECSTYAIWRSVSWYAFQKNIFIHDKVAYDAILAYLREFYLLRAECAPKLLSPLFNFVEVFHTTQIQYLHYSFFEYFIAEYIAEGLIEAHKHDTADVLPYLCKNLTPEISHHLMMIVNETQMPGFGSWLCKVYINVSQQTSNTTQRRVANNLVVYVLGRLREDVSNGLSNLLQNETDEFLRNGLYWSLCAVDGVRAVHTYWDELERNSTLAQLNRGYHLYYYSDLDRTMEPPYFDDEPQREWTNTKLRMLAFMQDPEYAKRVAIGRRLLDLYTFLDLCRFRHQRIYRSQDIDVLLSALKSITSTLSDVTLIAQLEQMFASIIYLPSEIADLHSRDTNTGSL